LENLYISFISRLRSHQMVNTVVQSHHFPLVFFQRNQSLLPLIGCHYTRCALGMSRPQCSTSIVSWIDPQIDRVAHYTMCVIQFPFSLTSSLLSSGSYHYDVYAHDDVRLCPHLVPSLPPKVCTLECHLLASLSVVRNSGLPRRC